MPHRSLAQRLRPQRYVPSLSLTVISTFSSRSDTLRYTGKTVAIVGSGSSGIQLLATIQPEVKQIYHWIRSPTWITSAFAQKYAGPGGKNFKCTWQFASSRYSTVPASFRHTRFCYPANADGGLLYDLFVDTDEQKKLFAEDPKHSLKYRKMIESELNQRFKFIVQGTPEQKAALEVVPFFSPTHFLVTKSRHLEE